jgi:hypothetical protein
VKTQLVQLNHEREALKKKVDEINLQLTDVEGTPEHFDDFKQLAEDFENDNGGLDPETLKIEMTPAVVAFDNAVKRIEETLSNNDVRKRVRVMLPSFIGKILANPRDGTFEVFNRSGKSIYKSFES